MDEFICGVNYWPRQSGVQMWKEWDAQSIDAEFRQMAAMSLSACRVFLLWEDFQPSEDALSAPAMAKFDELLLIARAHGVRLVPTFFTGHMSGENWDVPWRRSRDVYGDPGMLRAQVMLVREFARRYGNEDAILFWDLANEPDTFAQPTSVDAAWLWMHTLYREIKANDHLHQVTLGTHAGSILTSGPFRIGDVAEVCDFLCMHPYPSYTKLCPEPLDSLRSSLFVPFACKLTEGLGRKGVLLEEFGSTTQMASEDVEARFSSAALYSALANGALGALAWCFGDFAHQDRLPYESTPYEVGFGVTSVDGRIKQKGVVLAEFARAVRAARVGELSPAPARAAIVIPRRYYDNPDEENGPDRNAAVLFASYVLAKSAGINVDFVTTDALEEAVHRYKAVFVPCATRRGTLNVTDFRVLKEFVRTGGTLYCSYDGIAIDGMDELFGVNIACSSLPRSDEWSVDVPGCDGPLSAPLPRPTPALLARKHMQVSARSRQASSSGPIMNEYGRGRTILLALPFELYLATMPFVFEPGCQPFHAVYSLVGRLAGIGSAVMQANPAVETRELSSSGRRAIVVVNHEAQPHSVSLALPQAPRRPPAWSWRRDAPLHSEADVLNLTLGPCEGDIIEIP